MVDFGKRLKQLRSNAGLTQLQVAQQLGVTKSVVSFYELQERSPSPDVLVKMSSIFHVSTDYLLGLDNRKTVDVSDLTDSQLAAVQVIVSEFAKSNKQ